MTRLFLPQDAAALALGADRVLRALQADATGAASAWTMVRTGSRGAVWLEPLLEVETPEGRIGYGPVQPADVPACSTPAAQRRRPSAAASAAGGRTPGSPGRRG